jgi:hypothetical protein
MSDDLSIQITRFDFLSQIYSLITDKSLSGDLTQLDVNPEDPFSKYQYPNGRFEAFNSGKLYTKAHAQLCTKPNDWLCPSVYACNKTLVGSHLGRASVIPLVFTLSIFKMNRSTTSVHPGGRSATSTIWPNTAVNTQWSPMTANVPQISRR